MEQATLLDTTEPLVSDVLIPAKTRRTRSVPLNLVTPSATLTEEKQTVGKSLKELLAEQAALQEQIQLARLNETVLAWKTIDMTLQDHGLTVDDLINHYAPQKMIKQKFSRKPAEKKYQLGNVTWTGRGRPPKVIQIELDKGTPLESFLINKSF